MNPLQQKLIGALIGLARATDGNEHLITEESTSVIWECLAAAPSNEEELTHLLGKVDRIKRKMVPDCYLCANPCGRTAAFDLSQIDTEDPNIREAKYELLTNLLEFSKDRSNTTSTPSLYRGLIAIGLQGYPVQDLSQIL